MRAMPIVRTSPQWCTRTARRLAMTTTTTTADGSTPAATGAKDNNNPALRSRYEEAILKLNSLQSNASVLQERRKSRLETPLDNVLETRKFLDSLGIEANDINGLNVIHVSGTKGKGSTCAFVERILRDFGFKTGLYTSPHLVHVCERIRMNGEPIEEDHFAVEFFDLYDRLAASFANSLPAYFKFLTILAFRVFLKEKVDVMILEVGIGGESDCTNVVDKPVVCGVTTLDLDHMSILGNTLEEIAWQKAGIMKPGAPVVYAPTIESAEKVLLQRASEKQVKAVVRTPPLETYGWPRSVTAGIAGAHQRVNISLALQLVRTWRCSVDAGSDLKNGYSEANWSPGQPYDVSESVCDSIETCKWPGRSQVVNTSRIKFLLDGAHTPKSMEACANWAADVISSEKKPKKLVLLFQCTADRVPASLLNYLKNFDFDVALFCTTQVLSTVKSSMDSANFNQPEAYQLEKARLCQEAWKSMTNKDSHVFKCITSAVDWLQSEAELDELTVLVTGSLHLVGGVLNVIGSKKLAANIQV